MTRSLPLNAPYEIRRSRKLAETYAATHLDLIAGVRYERAVNAVLVSDLAEKLPDLCRALRGFRGEATDMPEAGRTREAM